MGFFLKKLIGFSLMPMTSSVILIMTGLVLLMLNKWQKLGKGFIALGVIYLTLMSWSPFGTWLLRPIEQTYAPISAEITPEYIVVLGNAVSSDDAIPLASQFSSSARARIHEGIRLAKLHPHSTLILTGYAGQNTRPIAEVYADYAVAQGIEQSRIITVSEAKDTKEEAIAAGEISEGKTLALVTSASHMPRAVLLFQQQNVNPVPAPTFYLAKWPAGWHFGSSGLLKSERALHEYVGTAWAKISG